MSVNTEYNNIREKNIDVNKRLEDNVKVHKVKQIASVIFSSVKLTVITFLGVAVFAASTIILSGGIILALQTPSDLLAALILGTVAIVGFIMAGLIFNEVYACYQETSQSAKDVNKYDHIVEARKQEINKL